MRILTFLLLFIPIFLFSNGKIEVSEPVIAGLESEIKLVDVEGEATLVIDGERFVVNSNEKNTTSYIFRKETDLRLEQGDFIYKRKIRPIPLWLSIIPPIVAIVLALVFKEVITSLLVSIFIGAFIIQYYSEGFLLGLLSAFMSTIDHYLIDAVNDGGHLSIIIFSMLIGAMVAVISRNGGMQGIVNRISSFATTPKSGQLATWFLGIAIFFDDYANTLIVGNTMRPITDKLKVSREKLAYLVDSTAAPIAAIAFITTWIGAELGYIQSGIENIEGINEGVYATFISSLKYSFYPILALIFMLLLILSGKEFGPMLKAEQTARNRAGEEEVTVSQELLAFEAKEGISYRSFNAILPVIVVVIGTFLGLLYTGWDDTIVSDNSMGFGKKLATIVGNADSYQALLWSSLSGLLVAIIMSVGQKILSLNEAVESTINGFKTMLSAIVILCLAWALALVIEDLHTSDFLTSMLSTNISPYLIPTVTFLLAAVVAFSTGSSWGTMAILYPLMLPAAWELCTASGMDYETSLSIFHNVVACVLAGAVLGDHCSPISDTTILSSLASSCNHIQHVKTQMPYALTVGAVAILFGTIPSAYGISSWFTFPIAIGTLYLIIRIFGKKLI